MDHKISSAIGHYPKANRPTIPEIGIRPCVEKRHAHYGIENEKGIITFKPGIMVFFMVVFVETPQKAMHNVFMGEPCHELHKTENS
tara:strand:- start:1804 stop:2061 length:258 start_codon:yes stop_codon:yes gene_type:complete